ncbi:hypothetical protein MMC34_004776 [Xylographa carneopallida]|nr:hypothetical protein [Xylographa carneopallida]
MYLRTYTDSGRYYNPGSGRMAGGYGLIAPERGRRHPENHEPIQKFSDEVIEKVIRNRREDGRLGPDERYVDSIHQPASRTMGSGVLYSSANLAGMQALRAERGQSIYDPPTLASYDGYKQKAKVFSEAASLWRGEVERRDGIQDMESEYHEEMLGPAVRWLHAADRLVLDNDYNYRL